MFAGKSSELLRRLALARGAGRTVLVLKSNIDTRYSPDYVVAHRLADINKIRCHGFFDCHCSGAKEACLAAASLADVSVSDRHLIESVSDYSMLSCVS